MSTVILTDWNEIINRNNAKISLNKISSNIFYINLFLHQLFQVITTILSQNEMKTTLIMIGICFQTKQITENYFRYLDGTCSSWNVSIVEYNSAYLQAVNSFCSWHVHNIFSLFVVSNFPILPLIYLSPPLLQSVKFVVVKMKND